MRRDGVDEMDDGQDGRCEVLETRDAGRMPADGVDGIDKMRDARWKRADEMENMGGKMERPRWKDRASPQGCRKTAI